MASSPRDASLTPRYLVPFHPKRQPHFFADVLVIGSGIAGIRAAMAVDPKLSVLIVTKDGARHSNSNFAQGGIAGVVHPDDDFDSHVEDTILAGGGLCDRSIVETVVRQAPEEINALIEMGTQFDREDGRLLLGKEGGHSHHRIVHADGDATGREVMRAMIAQAHQKANVQVWEHTFTLDLLTHEDTCRGAIVYRKDLGQLFVWAKQTILATGGIGQVYRETTNPPVATGDGHAMAYRAGARMADMEFVQFHPTVLYIAGSSRSLITEAMRGEGAILVDKDGHRFMPEYDERAELAPRDVVSQAIVAQMEKTRHPSVYLDLSHLDGQFVLRRFPGIARACAKFGIDISTDRIPVRPGAHYMIGGVQVDEVGRTSLDGLWAAGEVTSSGLHGANRLASNSLLEGLVYGASTGEGASQVAATYPDTSYSALPLIEPEQSPSEEPLDLEDIRNSLKSVMWRASGVRREAERLADAQVQIRRWSSYVLTRQFDGPEGWELQNLLTIGQLIIDTALVRQESRGVHLRTDFPNCDDEQWRRHLVCDRHHEPF